jgi:hypothetical protein
MDNSSSPSRRIATVEFDCQRLGRAEYPPTSPDLSPLDFRLFGFLKKKLKDHQLRGVQSIYQAITDLWDELIFEDVQAVFFE